MDRLGGWDCDLEIEWIRSHQKRKIGETLGERMNRMGNDAADELAVTMR